MSLVYEVPEMERVVVTRDIPFAEGLVMDVHSLPDTAGDAPAVVIVGGYPDPGFQRKLGFRFKEMPSNVAWARLIATRGLRAVTYTNVEPAGALDLLLEHLHPRPVALLASSGNVPLALSVLGRVKCAALLYGFMYDWHGIVSQASREFGFAHPGAVIVEKPLFVARAGQDKFPGLNETLDAFVLEAVRRNLPLTLANHPDGPHAFDLMHDSQTSRAIVRQVLLFLQDHL